jgi:hypothetical protein
MSWSTNIINVALTLRENNHTNNYLPKLNVLALASKRGFFFDNFAGTEGRSSGLLAGSWFGFGRLVIIEMRFC